MKKFKKLNVSICVMVAILLICASIPVVNAKAMDENGAISVDETLVNSIRNSKKAHIMRGENVISKVENGAKDYVNFDASSKKYIKTCDVYTIKNTSPCAMGNEVETIVTDIELTNAGQKKMGITTASSGGTLYKNGRQPHRQNYKLLIQTG